MDNKKTQVVLVCVVVVLAIAVIGLLATRRDDNRVPDKFGNSARQDDNRSPKPGEGAKNMMQAQVPADLTPDQLDQLKAGAADHKASELTFNITGGSFYYAPNEIRVKQGDKVKIVFANAGGMHNLILEAFNVKTKDLKTGESETIEFTADKKGTFEFYCGIGNGYHRQKGQIGVLLVD